MANVHITTPLTRDKVKELKAGDSCLISGVIYTARDAAHKRLCELVAADKELPMDVKDSKGNWACFAREGNLIRLFI